MVPTIFKRNVPVTATAWSPLSEFDPFREFDKLLNGSPNSSTGTLGALAVDVQTTDEGATVTAELPGFEIGNIDISVEQDVLTIRGSREETEAKEGETYHRRERRSGKFARRIALPFGVDSEAVGASYKDGVLTVNLPRAAEERVKRIAVKAA